VSPTLQESLNVAAITDPSRRHSDVTAPHPFDRLDRRAWIARPSRGANFAPITSAPRPNWSVVRINKVRASIRRLSPAFSIEKLKPGKWAKSLIQGSIRLIRQKHPLLRYLAGNLRGSLRRGLPSDLVDKRGASGSQLDCGVPKRFERASVALFTRDCKMLSDTIRLCELR
jgi:hypothetical protein